MRTLRLVDSRVLGLASASCVAALLLFGALGCGGDGGDNSPVTVVSECSDRCGPNARCENGECVPTDTAGRSIGAACSKSRQCGSGVCLTGQGIHGGYCSKRCGGSGHSHGSTCPDGSTCVQVTDAAAVCLDECRRDGDCRSRYSCRDARGASVCLPNCQSDGDCGPGEVCDQSSGICRSRNQKTGRLGSPCSAKKDCRSGACITEKATNGTWPRGACVSSCSADRAGKSCANGQGRCLGIQRDDGSKVHVCFQACQSGVECRDEYRCASLGNRSKGAGVCVPTCDHYECSGDTVCNTQSGACVEKSSGGVSVQTQNAGSIQVGPRSPQTVSFRVPPNAFAFGVSARANDRQKVPVLLRLKGPNDATLYDLQKSLKGRTRIFPKGAGGLHGFVYPNSPKLDLPQGTYRATYLMKPSGELSVDVVTKKGSVVDQSNSIPVVFWFLPGASLDAAQARNDRQFQNAIRRARQVFGQIGLDLGPIEYRDYRQSGARDHSVIDSHDELGVALSKLSSTDAAGMQVLIVDQFNRSGGGTTLGMTEIIGGPPITADTPKGGVGVADYLGARGAESVGDTIAHEIVHYMGLFHTTERNGNEFDPLPDTPKCPAGNDANNDGIVSPGECRGKGASNIVFWTGDGTSLTPNQKYVIQLNPMLR